MKIFHGPNNIAGAAGVLAKAQRHLGYDAEAVCHAAGVYKYQTDRLLKPGVINRAKMILQEGWSHDIFHFYFGQSLAGPGLHDVDWLRRMGKKAYFYFCGCDLRLAKTVIEKYEYSACKECWPAACSANRDDALEAARKSDGIFVSTPDLLEFAPEATWLPQPIELDRFHKLRENEKSIQRVRSRDTVRVAHGPSSRTLKGTRHLEAAIETLQAKGLPVELVLIENMSYDDALRACLGADIVVDQLLIGAYGQFSVEMMALGKPVICYIRDDLVSSYPSSLPVISANPRTIAGVLGEVVLASEIWAPTGQRGIEYVRNYHDSISVAKIAIDKYGI